MTLSEIRQRTREQTGDQYAVNTDDDALLNGYINEGNMLLYGEYLPDALEPMVLDGDVSGIPEAYHGSLSDYATGRVLSNGGETAQRRAQYFEMRFKLSQVQLSRHYERKRGAVRLTNKFGG